jgi:DNA-directed RNA polymerase subunit RPC12/RpoP
MKYECPECKSTFQHIECHVCGSKFFPKDDPIIMEIIESLKDAMKIFNDFKMSGGRIGHIKETLEKFEKLVKK